ncbi:hypothetical protein BDN72DRAFT_764779 [Pluteus cervinus]|uniref:Uncharacterized protein n=1 Tax=Pluteus cervinus TaxID=181527 RepID=A0ACD3B1U1_9AGAR|nr:hypothetical protein BDN72DRAFT_764779 [Pluteus cervinus]
MRLIYLPAYSPDLNPIEEAFSALKSWLRKYRTYVSQRMEGQFADPYALLEEAVYAAVTPAKVWGWYRHSKYI